MPSEAGKITCCGLTRSLGKSAGMESGARSRTGPLPILTAARPISVALERRNATAPSATSAGSHSIPSPNLAPRIGDGLPPADGHAPHVAAIDIVLIGGKQHLAAIARKRDVLDFEIARREKLRASAVGRNRIQMEPAVALPRKHQAIAVCPEDLVRRLDAAKRTAGTFFGMPHRAAYAAGRIRYPNRPRRCRIAHRTDGDRGGVCPPQECDAPAVGAPDGRRIAIDAGVQVSEGLGRDAVHADEAVIAAITGERERRAIGRPFEFVRGCFGVNGFDRLGLPVESGHPELPVFYKCNVAVARNGGSAAVAQFLGSDRPRRESRRPPAPASREDFWDWGCRRWSLDRRRGHRSGSARRRSRRGRPGPGRRHPYKR